MAFIDTNNTTEYVKITMANGDEIVVAVPADLDDVALRSSCNGEELSKTRG